MAEATAIIERKTGSGPTDTDITSSNTRLQASDVHTSAGTDNPIQVPDSGTNYSFWATMRLEITNNPDGNTISNMKWYTDGSNNLGTDIGLDVAPATAYAEASGTVGESGSSIDAAHPHASAASGAFNFDSTSPLAIDNSSTGTASTGEIGDYVINQITVATGAAAGSSSQETCTFQYDEQ